MRERRGGGERAGGRDGVRGERGVRGTGHGRCERQREGVGVRDEDARGAGRVRRRQVARECQCGVGVEEVVVGGELAVGGRGGGECGARHSIRHRVDPGALVRILAVAELANPGEREGLWIGPFLDRLKADSTLGTTRSLGHFEGLEAVLADLH